MGRRPVIEDAQILVAARDVFLEHGVRGTTADVAARAGISEGSIFNRFQSKDHLFRCAMHTGEPPSWVQGLALREGRGPLGRELEELGLELLHFFRKIIPLAMMSWSAPDERRDDGEAAPLRSHRALAAYFQSEMRRGRLRKVDPFVLAATFSGAVWNHAAMELMFHADKHLPPTDDRKFVRGMVELLLRGVGSDSPSTRTKSPEPRRGRGLK
jgi:AcrR family transcriptional regulator